MRYFLKELRIEGFRGINNEGDPLKLRFNTQAVNSIFAGNAFGKSSVFEALHFAISGTVPKLGRLDSSERGDDYYVNCFHTRGVGTIGITLQPSDGSNDIDVQVSRTSAGVTTRTASIAGVDPTALLESLRGEAVFLDYTTFVQFIEESPLKRGRSFSSLIGLAELSEVRQVLEVLSYTRTLKSDLEIEVLDAELASLRLQFGQNEDALRLAAEGLLGEGYDSRQASDLISEEACLALCQSPPLLPFATGNALGEIEFETVRAAIRDLEQGDKREQLALLLREAVALEALAPGDQEQEQIDEIAAAMDSYFERLAQVGSEALRTLYAAELAVLEEDSWSDKNTCPACNAGPQENLTDRIAAQLERYEEVERSRTLIVELWERATWPSRLRRLEEHELLAVSTIARRFHIAESTLRSATPTKAVLDDAWKALQRLELARASLLADRRLQGADITAALPPSLVDLTRRIEFAKQLADALALRAQLKDLGSAKKNLRDRRERWRLFATQAAKTFSEAEAKLSTQRMLSLETDYRSIYSQIMRNNAVSPKLVKSGSGEDLHLRLESFHGKPNLSANALLSESYRNAFAMAVFLSASRAATSGARFIILDDVTSSFDAGHQFALMEVLRNTVAFPSDPAGPQVIVLSHDGLLQKYFDRVAEEPNWHHQRLKGAAPTGLVMSDGYDSNRLRQSADNALSAGLVESAEPYVRQYLEFKLVQVIQKLGIPVPLDFAIRDDKQMVKNALDAITSAVALHDAANKLVLTSPQCTGLRNTYVPQIVSNWVNHYATGALGSFSPAVLRGVLDDVDSFVDCFTYSCTCTGTARLRFYKDLSAKHCRC